LTDEITNPRRNPVRRGLKYFVSASFLSLVLGFLSIYYTLRGSRTHMSMDIAAESNVLDVRHPIPDLAILFQGRDIEEEKSNLRVLTIRLINDGEANIRENDFDSRIPFGLRIDGGRIVRAQVTGSNSHYLSENLHPQVQAPDRIVFDKIIFDKERFVAVEVVILHQKNATPHVVPLGKIAGLDAIAVTNSFQGRDQQSFWGQVFSGAPAIQITRGIGYAFLALLTIVAVGFAIAGLASIPERFRKRKRRRMALQIQGLDDPEQEKKRKAVEAVYVEAGLRGIKRAQKLLADEEKLKSALTSTRFFYGGAGPVPPPEVRQAMMMHEQVGGTIPTFLEPLFSAELITFKDKELKIDPDVKALLDTFADRISETEADPTEQADS
jgi:hypothetical protein